MQQATVPGINPASEQGYTLDTGETVVVKLVRTGEVDPDWLRLVCTSRLVDPVTGAVIMVGGVAVETPPFPCNVATTALADNAVSLPLLVAQVSEQQAQRVRGVKAALDWSIRLQGA